MEACTPEDVEKLLTRADGGFAFARWGRPIVPVVFGLDDAGLAVIKGAIEAVAALARHPVEETDPELGANLILFFFRDWQELTGVPNLGRMVPELPALVARLAREEAQQYRAFRFDEAGAIQACFAFVRLDDEVTGEGAEALALAQAAGAVLAWSDTAFATRSPLARLPGGGVVLRPEIAGVIAAGYDPVLPPCAHDPSHALRLWARMQAA